MGGGELRGGRLARRGHIVSVYVSPSPHLSQQGSAGSGEFEGTVAEFQTR